MEILRALTKDGTRPRLGPGVDLEQLGADTRCEGFSGADVGNLVRQVRSQTEIVFKFVMISAANRLITTGFHNHGKGPY